MGSCNISLVVKNALLREGLSRILSENDFRIEQSIEDVAEVKFEFDDENHIIILGSILADKYYSKEISTIINRFRRSRSVILADKFDLELAVKFFAAGACAYILDNVPYKTFLAMMHLVSMGENVVPSQYISSVNNWVFRERDLSCGIAPCRSLNLTERDVNILRSLSLGLSNKMISRELSVSEATVKVSIKSIFRKLSVSNRTQAAILARDMIISSDKYDDQT